MQKLPQAFQRFTTSHSGNSKLKALILPTLVVTSIFWKKLFMKINHNLSILRLWYFSAKAFSFGFICVWSHSENSYRYHFWNQSLHPYRDFLWTYLIGYLIVFRQNLGDPLQDWYKMEEWQPAIWDILYKVIGVSGCPYIFFFFLLQRAYIRFLILSKILTAGPLVLKWDSGSSGLSFFELSSASMR